MPSSLAYCSSLLLLVVADLVLSDTSNLLKSALDFLVLLSADLLFLNETVLNKY